MGSIFTNSGLSSRYDDSRLNLASSNDKISSLPNTNYSIIPTNNSPINKMMDMVGANGQQTANSLQNRVGKLIKYEKKVIKQQVELIKEITSWLNIVPNEEASQLLTEFKKCIEAQRDIEEELVHRQENVQLQLTNVQKREKKNVELKAKRNKMARLLRDQESKSGTTTKTTLTKESLEELDLSADVVEEQYVRAINTSLKSALVDYVFSLQSISAKLRETSGAFFSYLNSNPSINYKKSIFGGLDNGYLPQARTPYANDTENIGAGNYRPLKDTVVFPSTPPLKPHNLFLKPKSRLATRATTHDGTCVDCLHHTDALVKRSNSCLHRAQTRNGDLSKTLAEEKSHYIAPGGLAGFRVEGMGNHQEWS
ncbi:hypothetical protein BABINDRAFT_118031 [Babjeviella inositovora NRRL Y-12698]|uniref:Uncharacterized protein n=1 Tax=Babjeviella inositovora NRRL Y-12698 TaxID=984486 RepID=A0A1E3QT90_9ASCO|nr:uncharacterized protein BABINDRAFT_118031 [Babjeviella inositovora NRRL Y-12698]ODQ80901.1 hypothetical protein BABINDRAFT_118031 [Babjeviella inositovora NRRL Y-12698]